MKKIIAVVGLMLLVSGCSSLSSKHNDRDTEVSFQQPNGGLTLVVDSEGNLVSVKAIATAEVLSDSAAGKEAAVTVASSRAKRTLTEFINNDIKSSNVIDSVAKATNENNTYAQNVTEKINVNAQAILRGAYISKQTLENGTAMVELTVTRASINGAQSLRKQMSGAH